MAFELLIPNLSPFVRVTRYPDISSDSFAKTLMLGQISAELFNGYLSHIQKQNKIKNTIRDTGRGTKLTKNGENWCHSREIWGIYSECVSQGWHLCPPCPS